MLILITVSVKKADIKWLSYNVFFGFFDCTLVNQTLITIFFAVVEMYLKPAEFSLMAACYTY